MLNNPIRFNDPTGHVCSDPESAEAENLVCYGSGTTRVGDRLVHGNGAESGRAKSFPIKKKEMAPENPWEYTVDVDLEMHIGPVRQITVPDHYGESEYPDNVPYIPRVSNPVPPNVCAGGAASSAACLLSLGSSIAIPYGPTDTTPNFFLSFSVQYNEAASSIFMSAIQMSNRYGGNATMSIKVNGGIISEADSYIPHGGFYPIAHSQGQYDGNNGLTVDVVIFTTTQTSTGPGMMPHRMTFTLPTLSDAKAILLP